MTTKNNINRQTVTEYVTSVLSDIDMKSIEEAFDYINKVISDYKEQRKSLNYEYVKFYFDVDYEGSLEIHCTRYQTEEEIEKQKIIQKEQEQEQKENKLKQYEQLKKELGL